MSKYEYIDLSRPLISFSENWADWTDEQCHEKTSMAITDQTVQSLYFNHNENRRFYQIK